MESLKIEIDTVCRGCLSTDRDVHPLNDNVTLFFLLLSDQFIPKDSNYFNVYLCWECIALLKRVARFQKQLQRSKDFFLAKCVENQLSLSKLNISHKRDYDIILEYEETIPKIELPEPKIQNFTHFMANNDTSHFHDNNFYDNELSHFDDTLIKEEYESCDNTEYIPPVKCKKRKKTKSHRSEVNIIAAMYKDCDIDSYISEVNLNMRDLEILRGKSKDMSSSAHAAVKRILEKMKKDLRKSDDTEKSCSECKISIPSTITMSKHWESHTIKLYKCIYCPYHDYHENMIAHLTQKHDKIYICKCEAQYRNITDYYRHYRNLHKKFDCDICNRKFLSKETIEKHMRHYHLPITCEICNKRLKSLKKLQTHYFIHHPEREAKPEKPYCVECDMKFHNEYLYKRHLRTSVAHRPRIEVKVPCPDCGKVFTRKTYMKNHYKLVHVRQSKHYCEICDKYFINGYSMRTHKKFVHDKLEKPKDKICDMCGRGFFTNRVLANHKRTHTGERPYKCSHCPAAFTQLYAMKTHERTQHKNYNNT